MLGQNWVNATLTRKVTQMKTLLAAVLFATLAAPAMAMGPYMTGDGVTIVKTSPGVDIFGRRSGRCREGSTCGGI